MFLKIGFPQQLLLCPVQTEPSACRYVFQVALHLVFRCRSKRPKASASPYPDAAELDDKLTSIHLLFLPDRHTCHPIPSVYTSLSHLPSLSNSYLHSPIDWGDNHHHRL